METVLAVVTGILYAAGVYLILRRSLARIVIGLALLTNATNLLIFVSAGLERGSPPLVQPGGDAPDVPHADPLPQALILTAIVIGFGVLAFAMVLMYRGYRSVGTDDPDAMVSTDRPEKGEDRA